MLTNCVERRFLTVRRVTADKDVSSNDVDDRGGDNITELRVREVTIVEGALR